MAIASSRSEPTPLSACWERKCWLYYDRQQLAILRTAIQEKRDQLVVAATGWLQFNRKLDWTERSRKISKLDSFVWATIEVSGKDRVLREKAIDNDWVAEMSGPGDPMFRQKDVGISVALEDQ